MLDSQTKAIEQAPDGVSEARKQIYDRYSRLVLATCMDTTGCMADAEDLAQDVFVRVFPGLNELREPTRFAGWLMSIMRGAMRGMDATPCS